MTQWCARLVLAVVLALADTVLQAQSCTVNCTAVAGKPFTVLVTPPVLLPNVPQPDGFRLYQNGTLARQVAGVPAVVPFPFLTGLPAGSYSFEAAAYTAGLESLRTPMLALTVSAVAQQPASPDGTIVPPATAIVDQVGATWTLVNGNEIRENGLQVYDGWGPNVLWCGGRIYTGDVVNNKWWRWEGVVPPGWTDVGLTKPACGAAPPPPPPPPPPQDACTSAPLTFSVTRWPSAAAGSKRLDYRWSGTGPITVTFTATTATATNGPCSRTVTK